MSPAVNKFELDKVLGALFIGGMPGPELDESTIQLIKKYHLSGIILFSRNIIDPIQLAHLSMDIQALSMDQSGIPSFLAVDQEGGRVARLTEPFTVSSGNSSIGKDPRSEKKARAFARITGIEMSLVGLNMDMAPVLDVAQPNVDPHLEGRCFSENPHTVSSLGRIVIKELQRSGIISVAKHFPGLGKSNTDPHSELPTVEADQDEMESIHFLPFAGAIEAHVSAIMSSHAVYPCLDGSLPATLSKRILEGLLREKMGFHGLVISDDLEMGAIANLGGGVPEGAANAFEAGVDLLLICSKPDYILESIEILKHRILKGDISFERVKSSLQRINECKHRFLLPPKMASLDSVKAYFKKKREHKLI